jgi:hypothetical protein
MTQLDCENDSHIQQALLETRPESQSGRLHGECRDPSNDWGVATHGQDKTRRVKLPVIHSKRPGTLYLDNARIFELIEFP